MSNTVRAYAHRSEFIKDILRRAGDTVEADKLEDLGGAHDWTPALPRGLDVPSEHKNCPICNEDIEPTDLVARMCPESNDKHFFHWNCMMEWLGTWCDRRMEFQRTCPCCRTEMFTLSEPSRISQEERRLRWRVDDRMDVLNSFYRIHTSYRSAEWPFNIPVIDVPGVTLRYHRQRYHTLREYWLAIAMGLIGSRSKVVKLRTMIFMYDDAVHLDRILARVEALMDFMTGDNLEAYPVAEHPMA